MVHEEKIKMTQLLQFIVTFLPSLFDEYGFYIKESKNSGNRFSGSSILIASSEVEIFLAIERDEMTSYFRSLFDKRKSNWYSSEVILALLGHIECRGVLDENNSSLIRDEMSEILKRFHKNEIRETLRLLDGIEKERSKRK